MTVNPYDLEDTCQCSAWSEGECACGGYVDPAWKRIWQKGYDAATARAEKAEQQCRDLCQSDGDVRARLADAENALAKVKSALLMGGQTAGIRAQAALAIVWDGKR